MILFNCFTSKINRLLLQLIVWTFTIERFERSLSKKSLSRKKSIVALQLRVLVFLFWVLALRVLSFLFFSWDLKVDECQSNLYVMSKYLFFFTTSWSFKTSFAGVTTLPKKKFSVKDFSSKCDQICNCGFGHIYWRILNGKLHFLCSAFFDASAYL